MTIPDSQTPANDRASGPEDPSSSGASREGEDRDGFLYDGFISYSRLDLDAADKIERDLETFPLPREIRKRLGRRHLNVFRDVNDLTGNRLEPGIEQNLKQSRTLIVLCSPAARGSKFVGIEINRFAQLRDATQIVPALIAGKPNNDPGVEAAELAFPDALSGVLDSDPLAVDMRTAWSMRGRKAKLARGSPWVQLVAGIVGATTDELTERIAKAQRRRLQSTVAVLTVVLTIVGALGVVAWKQRDEARLATQKVLQVQQLSRFTSDIGAKPQRSLLLAIQAAALATEGRDENLLAIDGIRQQLRVAGGRPLLGGPAPTRAASFSSDRRWLATGSDDGTIRVWHMDAFDPAGSSASLTGHRGAIRGLAFTPDSQWLVSGGADGTIRLWRLTNGGATAGSVLGGHYGDVEALAISHDGTWLAFGTKLGNTCVSKRTADGFAEAACEVGKDRDPVMHVEFSRQGHWLATACAGACSAMGAPVSLWNLDEDFPNREPRRLTHATYLFEDSLLALAFSADETRLAVAYGYITEVWDLTQSDPEEHVVATAGRGQWVYAVALSPDNRWLATGSLEADVMLSDLTRPGSPPVFLKGHSAAVRSLSFSDDGRWLASASDDATARVWNMTDPTFPSTLLRGQDMPVGSVMFSPGAQPRNLLVTGTVSGDEPNPRLWSIPDPLIDPVVLRNETASVLFGMAVSPDGRWIATSSQGNANLVLWSTDDHRTPAAILPMSGSSHSIAFSPDARWIAAKDDENGVISLWDLRNLAGPPVDLFDHAEAAPDTVNFSPDGRWLVSGTWSGDVNIWDVSNDSPATTPRYQCAHDKPVRGRLAFSPDGHLLVTAAHGLSARLWNLASTDPCASPGLLGPHNDVVADVAVSADSRWAATASFDHKGRLWEITADEPKLVAEIPFDDRVTQAAFSPDNHWVAFGSWDRTAKVLDLKDAEAAKPVTLAGHAGRILSLAFTPTGRWLATGSEDRTIRLWDPSDPATAPVILRGHEAAIFALGFTNDGRRIVSGATDGTVRLWRLKLSDLIDAACQVAGRDLSDEEVSTFLTGAHPQHRCTK
jgi:WD40 repeat protein